MLSAADVQTLLAQPEAAPAAGGKQVEALAVAPAAGSLDLKDAATRKRVAEALLGHGFNLWTNKPTQNRCVAYPASYAVITPAVAGVPSKYNWSNMAAVTNLSEHVSNSSLGGSASLTFGAFSLGLGASTAQSNQFSSYSSYIDIDKGLVGDVDELSQPPQSVTPIQASAVAKIAIATGGTVFATRCGQAYVSRVMFGEHLSGTLDYVTTMNQNASSNSVSVSAAVGGIIGGSFSAANGYQQLNSEATVTYNVTSGPAKEDDQSKWVADIRAYGADSNFNQSNTWIVVDTTSYGEISDNRFANFITADTLARGTMATLRANYTDDVQLLSDLLFARNNPTHFTGVAPAVLNQEITDVSNYLDAIGGVYHTCEAAVDKAGMKACTDAAKALKTPAYIARPTLS